MTTLDRTTNAVDSAPSRRRTTPWALTGCLTGLLGIGATLLTDLHPAGYEESKTVTVDVVDEVSRGTAHVSLVLGYLTVASLLVLSALWRRHVEPRAEASTAARVVTHGLLAAAGALTLGYGYKGMLAIYMHGGINGEYLRPRRALHDVRPQRLRQLHRLARCRRRGGGGRLDGPQGAHRLALDRRLERPGHPGRPAMVVGTAVPGFPGVLAPLWMVVAFAGLAFGRSPITR